jgi:hypothetical protein
LIPENCLKIMQCIAVKIAIAGVAGSYISIPYIASLLIDALLADLMVGTGIPEGCRAIANAAYLVFEYSIS